MNAHQLCSLSPTEDTEYSSNLAVGERAGVRGESQAAVDDPPCRSPSLTRRIRDNIYFLRFVGYVIGSLTGRAYGLYLESYHRWGRNSCYAEEV